MMSTQPSRSVQPWPTPWLCSESGPDREDSARFIEKERGGRDGNIYIHVYCCVYKFSLVFSYTIGLWRVHRIPFLSPAGSAAESEEDISSHEQLPDSQSGPPDHRYNFSHF